jgi:glycosyltransferase involved in cell wall biosynthesis
MLGLLRAEPRHIALLVGRGGARLARDLEREADMGGRIVATGGIDGEYVAAHLCACDVLVQPYPDGVSSRRTSVMAGLALGVPTATNDGFLTEPLWRESRAVALAPSAERLAEVAKGVLDDPAYAATLGERGRLLYARRFSLDQTIDVLRGVRRSEPS